jgi:type IV secretory pathway TraG/TraD family ATPase VirD4
MYRLLVDLAFKEALSSYSNGHTHIFLDELNLLPKVSHLADALNFGRSKRLSVVAGLQSVQQIYTNYEKERGSAILSGFGSTIALKLNDFESKEYIKNHFGRNKISYTRYDGSSRPHNEQTDGCVVEDWDLQDLTAPGNAIVGLASQITPFRFDFSYDTFDKQRNP